MKTYSYQVNLGFTEKTVSACGGTKGKTPGLFTASSLTGLLKKIVKIHRINVEQINFTFQPNPKYHTLAQGDLVIVPSPSKKDDYWKHEFVGRIHCFKDNGLVCIIDQDDNGWDVEYNRLVLVEVKGDQA